jgi:hypothetical protein
MFSKFENHFQSRSRSGRPDSEKRTIFNAFDTKADLELLEGVENLIVDFHKGMQLILASSASK